MLLTASLKIIYLLSGCKKGNHPPQQKSLRRKVNRTFKKKIFFGYHYFLIHCICNSIAYIHPVYGGTFFLMKLLKAFFLQGSKLYLEHIFSMMNLTWKKRFRSGQDSVRMVVRIMIRSGLDSG
jgi:hypothetical protein